MRYLFAIFTIVTFNVLAAIVANYTGDTHGEVMGLLAVGGLAVIAGDFYTTKEGR